DGPRIATLSCSDGHQRPDPLFRRRLRPVRPPRAVRATPRPARTLSLRRAAERSGAYDARPLRQGPARPRHGLRAHRRRPPAVEGARHPLRHARARAALVDLRALRRAADRGARLVLRSRGAQSLSHLRQARQLSLAEPRRARAFLGVASGGGGGRGLLGRLGEHDDAILAVDLAVSGADLQRARARAAAPGERALLERREKRRVAGQHAELAGEARNRDLVDVGVERRALRREHLELHGPYAASRMRRSPFATASSMVPTMWNAASGRLSCLPSRISLKPRMVSLSSTYLPSAPVNALATSNGCDRKRWMRRARPTSALSSSESSSMPRMAMMSWSSL